MIGLKPTGQDLITFTIELLHQRTRSWLLQAGACGMNVFALQRCDGLEGIFSNWITGQVVQGAKPSNRVVKNVSQRDAADEMLRSVECIALPGLIDLYEMSSGQKAVPPAVIDINSIHGYGEIACGFCAESNEDPCQHMVAACDSLVAPAFADMLFSPDGGQTWTPSVAQPFAAGLDVTAVRMFPISTALIRTLAARETDAGAAQVAWSDDYGATAWNVVTVGATPAEFVVGDGALFVLDQNNIWLCTDQGDVYKSEDKGLTWVEQATAIVASGGAVLNCIYFLDEHFGVAVGVGDVVIYTVDGGINWTTAAVTGSADALSAVIVHSRARWSITTATGHYYMTFDGGLTYTQLSNFDGANTGSITNLKFMNDLVGFMSHTIAAVGYMLRTIDGGYSWNRIPGTNGPAGFDAIHPCGDNQCFAAGPDDGTMPVIIEAKAW